MQMKKNSIQYYNNNSADFENSTLNANMTDFQDRFLSLLSSGSKIMDFGCGAGRDTKYFVDKGFDVYAVDGSSEMCRLTEMNSGIKPELVTFQDYKSKPNTFDGIWACASLLHLSEEELPTVFTKLYESLKKNGILYCSFKYGDTERHHNERFFCDMNENRMKKLLTSFGNSFELIDQHITDDVRPSRNNEKWLNVLLRKN